MKVANKENPKNNVVGKGSIIEFPEVWQKDLAVTAAGSVKNTIPNYVIILKNDKDLKGKFRLNEHSKRVEIKDLNRFSWYREFRVK